LSGMVFNALYELAGTSFHLLNWLGQYLLCFLNWLDDVHWACSIHCGSDYRNFSIG
jgi:hypothetical protein